LVAIHSALLEGRMPGATCLIREVIMQAAERLDSLVKFPSVPLIEENILQGDGIISPFWDTEIFNYGHVSMNGVPLVACSGLPTAYKRWKSHSAWEDSVRPAQRHIKDGKHPLVTNAQKTTVATDAVITNGFFYEDRQLFHC